MTTLRQAAQQALEALIDAANVLSAPMFADAAAALRTALAQPEQRKPLTYESIWQIATDCTIGGDLHADKFARAIEAAHNIKEQP